MTIPRAAAASPWTELATVERGGFIESRHFGSLIALDATGRVVADLGSAREPMLPRSTVKPIQALACLEAGVELSGHHLALAAASHLGEDRHVEGVREILASAGLTENDLQCPPDVPGHAPTRRRLIAEGAPPARIRMNCSGKHAAMLAACVAHGWPTSTYLDPHHPLQQSVARLLSERAGEPLAHVTVDGCGAPLFGVTLLGLATAIRSLVVDPSDSPSRRVVDAMRAHPFYVAGSNHPNTVVMEKVPGVLCKGGAEGVIVAVGGSGCAVAAKIIDGSARATTAIALAALAALGENTSGAADLREVPVLGGGIPVGAIRATDTIADAIAAGIAG